MESPRIRHEADQLGALLRDVMPAVASVRDSMMDEGFTREEAVEGSYRVLLRLMELAVERPEDGPNLHGGRG